MKSAFILCTFVVLGAMAAAYPYEEEQSFYQVPLRRLRRQSTSVNIDPSGQSTLLHKGTIWSNPDHRLDGSASVSKNILHHGPVSTGGALDYSHQNSGSGVHLDAIRTGHFGTDVNALGRGNLWQANGGNTRLDAVGGWSRHYGGPGGNGRPNWNTGLQFTHRF